MGILIFLCAGLSSAAVVLALSTGTVLLFLARARRNRETDPSYGQAVSNGLRVGLVAGLAVASVAGVLSLAYCLESRRVVIDYWWSLSWVFNAMAAGGAAMLVLAWFLRSLYLRAKGRIAGGPFRMQMTAVSCAYLCLWASVLAAYHLAWRPWYRACAMRTLQEVSFSRQIFPALRTFVRQMSPEEEREITSWLTRRDNPMARFNAAYVLARRSDPEGRHIMATMLIELEQRGTHRHDVAGRYLFPLGLARACIMQMTGYRPLNDDTPPEPIEWQAWKRNYLARPTVVNHVTGPPTE